MDQQKTGLLLIIWFEKNEKQQNSNQMDTLKVFSDFKINNCRVPK